MGNEDSLVLKMVFSIFIAAKNPKILFVAFLPPTNEVWGKVMFLHACVILLTGGGGSLYDATSCLADWSYVPSGGVVSVSGPMFLPGGIWGSLYSWESLSEGVSAQGDPRTETLSTVMSGCYASYWNAFLLYILIPMGREVPSKLISKMSWNSLICLENLGNLSS